MSAEIRSHIPGVCTMGLRARASRRVLTSTGSPVHLITVCKQSFFPLSTNAEALIGIGPAVGWRLHGEQKQTHEVHIQS